MRKRGQALLAGVVLVAAARPAVGFDVVTSFQLAGTTSGEFLARTVSCGTTVGVAAGNLLVLSSQGVGHDGGLDPSWIDSGEEVFIGNPLPRPGFGYRVSAAIDLDGDGAVGESFVEARDGEGSLGVVAVSGTGWIDVSALFGGAAVRSVSVTAIDAIRIVEARRRLGPGDLIELKLDQPSSGTYAEITQCGVHFDSEQEDLTLTKDGGLGVAAGAGTRIDEGETVRARFPAAVAGVAYEIADAIDLGGSTVAGDHFVEAFDAEGAPLGLRSVNGHPGGRVDLADEYGDVLVSGFDLIAVNDRFRVARVEFVPEPGAAGSAAALAWLAWRARRAASRVARA